MRKARGGARPACSIIHETEPASYGWATVKNSNTNTMFDIVRADPDGRARAARRLDPARPRRDSCSRRRAWTSTAPRRRPRRRDFKPVAAQGRRSAPKVDAKTEVITSHNVVGLLPGSQISRRDRDLHGALGPSRHRQARRERRHHL